MCLGIESTRHLSMLATVRVTSVENKHITCDRHYFKKCGLGWEKGEGKTLNSNNGRERGKHVQT